MSVFISSTGNGLARAEQLPDGGWTVERTLEGRYVHCLAKDLAQPGVVYAGVQDQGVWRSQDSGRTWQPAGLSGQVVKAITVSPHDSAVMYAGTRPARLYVSRDGARTWQEIESFQRVPGRWWWFSPAGPPFTAMVQAIGVSPGDSNTLVVGIEFGAVVRSTDGGETWQGHRRGALRDCHSLTFHTSDGNWVYEAGGSGAGVAFSQDGGFSWQQPRQGLNRHYGWACAADPQRPEVWYASLSPGFTWAQPGVPAAHVDGHANAGIYRSIGGGVWQRLSGGLPEPLDYMAYSLLTDPESPGSLWAGLSNGEVWEGRDYGAHWTKLPFSLGGIHRCLVRL